VEALTRSGGWGLFLLYMIDANALLPPAIGYSVRRGNIPRNDNWQKPHLGGAGKSMFLTFEYSVMYVLSFATIITVFATAIALAWGVHCRGRSRRGAALSQRHTG
jgi:hypothetical protein